MCRNMSNDFGEGALAVCIPHEVPNSFMLLLGHDLQPKGARLSPVYEWCLAVRAFDPIAVLRWQRRLGKFESLPI